MSLGNTNFGFSGGGSSTPPPSTTSWMLNGNTVGSEKYFGTNDNFSIPLHTNGVARGILTNTGNFGIGTIVPTTKIQIVADDFTALFSSIRYQTAAAQPAGLVGLKARGNSVTPLPILSGDEIATFAGIGYHDGGDFGTTGNGNSIFYAAENFTTTNRGTGYKLGTTPIGTSSVVYNFGVDSEGNTSMGMPSLSPTARLHVVGVDSTSSNYALKVDNSASSPLLYVRNDGNIGISISLPSEKLHVNGNIRCDNLTASQIVGTDASKNLVSIPFGTTAGTVLEGDKGLLISNNLSDLSNFITARNNLKEWDLRITTGNQSTTSNVATNITDLVSPTLTANKLYDFEGHIYAGCNNTGGVKFQITIPTGAAITACFDGSIGSNSTFQSSLVTASATLTGFNFIRFNGSNMIKVKGQVLLGGTAGTIQFGFASAINTQTSTINKLGTHITLRQLD